MSTFDYAEIITIAQDMITEFGRSVQLLQFDSAPDDAARPWNSNTTPRGNPDATLTLDAAFVEPNSIVQLGLSAEASDLIKRSEQIMIVSPGATEDIRKYHEVVDGSESWKIEMIEVLKPGDDIVLAFIGVRR